jgi:hypothetical protein
MKTATRPHPMRTAVPEAELIRSLTELVTVVTSVPETERAGWWYSMQAFARSQHDGALYPLHKLAGAWMKAAAATWPEWPPQEPGE